MLLDDIRLSYVKTAAMIKGWQEMNKNDLANLYIKHEKDEILRDAYFSALICRYWGNIGKYYTASKNSVFGIEECYDWLVHALMYALEKRKWTDPSNALYKDKNGPDKVINRCIASTRSIFYQAANTDKRKANHIAASFDEQKENLGDYAEAVSEEFDDSYDMVELIDAELTCIAVIDKLLEKHEYVNALIVDAICFFDTFQDKKVNKTYKTNFSERLLTEHLSTLSENFITYFKNRYKVLDEKEFDKVVSRLTSITKTRLYVIIRKGMQEIQMNAEVREMLC